MGWHTCEYLTYDEAKKMNLRNIDVFHSSGDVTLSYASGNTWRMPDMARLYVELGWVPPQAFINDVMNSKLVETQRSQTRGGGPVITPIGYLDPKTDKLPQPFGVSAALPTGFQQKFELQLAQASQVWKTGHDQGVTGRTVTNEAPAEDKKIPPPKKNGFRGG